MIHVRFKHTNTGQQLCRKCGGRLATKRQRFYCSEYCQKLYLKAQYRKRNREKINAYRRHLRKQK